VSNPARPFPAPNLKVDRPLSPHFPSPLLHRGRSRKVAIDRRDRDGCNFGTITSLIREERLRLSLFSLASARICLGHPSTPAPFPLPPLSLCRPRTAVRCRATLPGRDLSECACFSRLESANKLPRLRPDNPAGVERNDKGLISEMVRQAMIGRYRAVRRGGGGRSVGACRVRPGFVSFRVILFRNARTREFCNGKSKSFRIHVVCMLV